MIPSGYKQTEIGIIPEDWEVKDFGEVGNYYKGGGISMRDVRPTGFPCIMYGDIYVKFDTGFKKCDYRIDYDTAKNSVKASPQDLFFTASGETADDIGRCVSYQGEDNIYIGGDIIALHPSDEYDSLFLAYVQNSEKVKKQKASFAQGHSVVHISADNIKKTLFAAPKYPEQKRIAEALSDVDELIASLEKLIEKKKALKQGVMQELLTGKRRLPGFTGEWIEKSIGELGFFVSGNGFPLFYQGEKSGHYPFYKVSDFNNVGNENYLTVANNYVEPSVIEHLHCNIIPAKSIVFAKIGAAIFLERKKLSSTACCIDNNMMAFQPNENVHPNFIWHLFQTISFGSLVEATALPSLSGKIIGDVRILLPVLKDEQIAIANTLDELRNDISSSKKELQKFKNLKSGMMSELLTGRIRLI